MAWGENYWAWVRAVQCPIWPLTSGCMVLDKKFIFGDLSFPSLHKERLRLDYLQQPFQPFRRKKRQEKKKYISSTCSFLFPSCLSLLQAIQFTFDSTLLSDAIISDLLAALCARLYLTSWQYFTLNISFLLLSSSRKFVPLDSKGSDWTTLQSPRKSFLYCRHNTLESMLSDAWVI